ncbi:quinone-dependent dihydroorotate dehydrogenase [Amorphus orientalis]|uniref:Dihydroorotate dehydrogenase (quinone) n=1 Tax=Amorphus orientalis TaxID=649198 RepID=A0AAE3VKE4_9HYPH|nr:quinone-dependent dihydroorotate dehydrogenase [Amorphus orientalis]MDQ0313789.1 dihydroorotate dehydrogenase [Amorphus orientalis]
MNGLAARFGPRALHLLDPERAHRVTIRLLSDGLVPADPVPADPALSVRAFGLDFPNPLGMAAGFDKDAEVPDALLKLGFGFVEVGTVTPLAQPGNPRPRAFRLRRDHALINRFGFNSEGHAAAHRRLAARPASGIVGVNLGANKISHDRIDDYVRGIGTFADVASYFTINISSPNTPGLRDLQGAEALKELLARVATAREEAASTGRRVPLLVKVAPDLDELGIDTIARTVLDHGIDGLIVSNTTIARPNLREARLSGEAGGLSGKPLFHPSTVVLARFADRLEGKMPLVGVGGITSGATAFAKIAAGASLIQVYTGLVYDGALVGEILRHLGAEVRRRGLSSITEAVGCERDAWARGEGSVSA